MKTSIQDRDALLAVSPVALSAYARAEGWSKAEAYGDFSDIYVADGLPEIILPRTENLGDYADVVSTLIGIFARVADVDELTLYRDLVTADRDVIRMRAADSDDGTVSMNRRGRLRAWSKRNCACSCLLLFQTTTALSRRGEQRGTGISASDALGADRTGQLCCHATFPGCAPADATDS